MIVIEKSEKERDKNIYPYINNINKRCKLDIKENNKEIERKVPL